MNLFRFELHTPYRLFCDDDIQSLVVPLDYGEIGILAAHSPFTAPVKAGILKIKDAKGAWRMVFISEGIIEVKKAKTILLSGAAEEPRDIDVERARLAVQDAEKLIGESSFHFEKEKAKAKLLRARSRLKAASLASSTTGRS
jgi:F-type H+-transporting ATPase subunit epsilon